MYRRNVDLTASSPSKMKRMAAAIIRGLTWFAHRSDGALYAEDLGPPFEQEPKGRTFSRLPHAELSEEQRSQAIEEIRRRPRIG
jgi:hypothetical protein